MEASVRVALFAGYKHGAIDQVMRALHTQLQSMNVEADLYCTYDYVNESLTNFPSDEFIAKINKYDVAHFGYYKYATAFRGRLDVPCTINLWHIPIGIHDKYAQWLKLIDPARIVVDDGDAHTLQTLGQMGFYNCTYIPILFDYSRFSHLPPPPTKFTVGIFCNNYPYKRVQTIVEACRIAGVDCHAMVTQEDRKIYGLDPVKNVYAHCHVMAHATFVDTNSLPMREALLCGRPILTVHSGGLDLVARDKVNSVYYDGSVHDLVRAIKYARDNYEALTEGARSTLLPSPTMIARSYLDVFEDAMEDWS